MFWNKYCSQYNHKNPYSALYCSQCSERLAAVRCQCGSDIAAGGAVCSRCGRDAEGHKAADMGKVGGTRAEAGRYWARDVDEIATLLESSDLVQEYFAKGIEIELGTEGLLLQDGAYIGTLRPGRHDLKTLGDKLRLFQAEKHTKVVLFDAFDVTLAWKAGPYPSKDPQDVSAKVETIIRIKDPAAFFTNVMKGRSRVTREDMQALFDAPLRDVLRDAIRNATYDELRDSAEKKAAVEAALIGRVESTLRSYGVSLAVFRLLQFECPFFDEKLAKILIERRGEIATNNAVYDLDLEVRWRDQVKRAKDDVALEDAGGRVGLEGQRLGQDREIVDFTQRADHLAKRLPFLRRLLEGDNLDRMAKLTSEEDWAKFRKDVDKDQLLREHEWTMLRGELSSKEAEDTEKRKHAYAILQSTHKFDLEQLELLNERRLTESASGVSDANRAEVEKQVRHDLSLKEQAHQAELKHAREVFDDEVRKRTENLAHTKDVREMQLASIDRLKRMKQWEQDQIANREIMVVREKTAVETSSRLQIMEMETRRMQMFASSGLTQEQMLTLVASGNADVLGTIASNRNQVEAAVAAARMEEMQRRLEDAKSDKKEWQDAGRRQLEETSRTAQVVGSSKPMVIGPGGVIHGGGSGSGVAPYFCEKHQMRHDGVLCPMCKLEGGAGA